MSLQSFSDRLARDAMLDIEGMNVICRSSDGYINATQLCKAGGKEFKAYMRIEKTSQFLHELSESVKIFTDSLIKYEDFGPQNRATWVHPRVAINIAQWISPKFDVKVTGWIHELLVCGSVSYGIERSSERIMKEQLQQLQNTLYHMNGQFQLAVSQLQEKDSIIVEKDTKIMTLEEKLDEYMRRFDISDAKTDKIMDELVTTKSKLDNNTNMLQIANNRIEQTYVLLEDVASRAIPPDVKPNVIEILFIYNVKASNDTAFGQYFTMRGVQKKGQSRMESDMRSKYGIGNFKLIKEYRCAPNSILLKNSIRNELKSILTVKYSDITLHKGISVNQLTAAIDTVYNNRYNC